MKQKTTTFSETMLSLESEAHPLLDVFTDFLDLLVDGMTVGLDTTASYRRILGKYPEDEALMFKDAIARFQAEFEELAESNGNTDILGGFYETHFLPKERRFIPWETCRNIVAGLTAAEVESMQRVAVDPRCGSGRLLLAYIQRFGVARLTLGIDPDPLLAKMAAVNLFCRGAFIGEIMSADMFGDNDEFRFSYRMSLAPYGLIPIREQKMSRLWHMSRDILVALMDN